MADRRPPGPKLPTVCKPPVAQAALPAPPAQQEQDAVQNVDPVQQDLTPPLPAQVPDPVQPPAPPFQVPNPVQPQLNQSYFKPEFSGKPEKDVEAHLTRTNDWMEIPIFQR